MIPSPSGEPLTWYKSSRSAGNGCCVETAVSDGGMAVRDSKDPDGPVLHFTAEAWQDFVSMIKLGAFDHS